MDEPTGQIETHLGNKREDWSSNFNELERKVKSASDWREHYKNNYGAYLAGALGGGLVLSLLMSQRKPASISQAMPKARQQKDSIFSNQLWQQHLEDMKGALIGAAATQARNIISKLVPGFEEQLTHKGAASGSDASTSPSIAAS